MRAGVVPLLKKVRSDLVNARGKLSDIQNEYHWEDRIMVAEHGLTLVIAHLYNVVREIEKAQRYEAEAQKVVKT